MASSGSVSKVESGFWTLGAGELREFERKLGRHFSAEDVRKVDDLGAKAMLKGLYDHLAALEQEKMNVLEAQRKADMVPGPHNVCRHVLDEKYLQDLRRPGTEEFGEREFWYAAIPDDLPHDYDAIIAWVAGYGFREPSSFEGCYHQYSRISCYSLVGCRDTESCRSPADFACVVRAKTGEAEYFLILHRSSSLAEPHFLPISKEERKNHRFLFVKSL